jgi:hypothetical protein
MVFFDLKRSSYENFRIDGEKYGITFTDGENTFSRMDDFGQSSNLKQIIDMKASDRSKAEQPGIPTDSTDNQLKDWIYNARL